MRATILLAVLLFAPAAVADPPDERCHNVTLVIVDGRRVYRADCPVVVPGTVQRPWAFDVSHRASRVYTPPEVARAGSPAVVGAVRRAPF